MNRVPSRQIVAAGNLPEGGYPGEEVLASTIGDLCAEAFDSAVTDRDWYELISLRPTITSRSAGRGYSRLVVADDGSLMTDDVVPAS